MGQQRQIHTSLRAYAAIPRSSFTSRNEVWARPKDKVSILGVNALCGDVF